MKITRKFTKAGQDPFSTVEWTTRASRISNPDGSVVFEMPDAQVPATWSQLATDIMVSKYFRKAGVPTDGGPRGIASHTQSASGKAVKAGETGPEKSAKQVIHRLAGCWRHWGETHGYFDSKDDAQAFYDELAYMLTHQIAAPNSPQWFNTGLNWAYGINGPAQGHWIADHKTGELKLAEDAYTHPQPHACFIQSVERRPRQRRRDHGPVDARGAAVQVRQRHGHQLQPPAGRGRAALRRREVIGPDELAQDRRPGRVARSSRAAPPAARRRWSAWTWTTRTSTPS
jgi:hypothetical protein